MNRLSRMVQKTLVGEVLDCGDFPLEMPHLDAHEVHNDVTQIVRSLEEAEYTGRIADLVEATVNAHGLLSRYEQMTEQLELPLEEF